MLNTREVTAQPPHPLPNTIVSFLTPSCTTLCYCSIHSRTATASACLTGDTVNGGGWPPPVSPPCSRRADARSEPLWRSVLTPSHYNPQLGSASTLPSLEIHPVIIVLVAPPLTILPPILEPPSLHHPGFVSAQPVIPSPSPSCTQGS